MKQPQPIFRVVKEDYQNRGYSDDIQSTTVLYCGFDRDEARRVYHENEPMDRRASPGNYGCRTRFQRISAKPIC